MTHAPWLWAIPALPLVGSVLCGVLHFLTLSARRRDPDAKGPAGMAGVVAALAVGASFGVAVAAFWMVGEHHAGLTSGAWEWIDAGSVRFDVSMVVDRLSSVMCLVICGVGFLIHLYASGYMKGDPGYAKFFAYLNLFVFAMLLLVLSSNLLGLFIGWEGVGLCSYLLIGFWYDKGWPAEAGQKAFVVNRIGDACFLVGSFLLVSLFGTLDFGSISSAMDVLGNPENQTQLALAALLLFGGAMGKSAQLPLFVWLPDAMAGPTPVSALIHAATMVTAGIYLIVRMNALFAVNAGVLLFIGIIGCLTALIAGSTALAQRDIKKVLAYSTVSQLGYMFLALGCGAFAAAIFHLVTHAFFKALLFLGAGSVIHGMHDEQDMHRMGGLRKHMPATHMTFLVGSAALAGIPPLSGFFSKDEILAHTFAHGGVYYALWAVGVLTAAMTAFYTWRMVGLTFYGEERFDAAKVHPHESPKIMTGPLYVLAGLAVLGGLFGLPPVFHLPHTLSEWLAPVLAPGQAILGEAHHLSHTTEWILLGFGTAVALFFAHKGFHTYKRGIAADEELTRSRPALTSFLGDAWGIDRAYQTFVIGPLRVVAFTVAVVVDQFAIDGAVNGVARAARELGARVRHMAGGSLQNYGLWVGGGACALAAIWMWGAA